MCVRLARILTVLALSLTAGLSLRAHAAPMTPGAANTVAQAAPAEPAQVGAAGVRGIVLLHQGDIMLPSMLVPFYVPDHAPAPQSKPLFVPVSAALMVFKDHECVATLRSSPDGRFQLALPAGQYTIVAQAGGDEGEFIIDRPARMEARVQIQVREGQWTDVDIRLDR